MATVLLVDPDHRFVARTRRLLEASGHSVVAASCASEALNQMHQQTPDAVVAELILDYVLAGWDLVREMRGDPALREVPVVIATSLTVAHAHSQREQAGCVDVSAWLTKPVSPSSVLQCLVPLLTRPEAP
ncbi:MAG: response regulator [Anaerolineae bacterium]